MKLRCQVITIAAILLSCGAPDSSSSSQTSVVEAEASPKGIGEIKSVTLENPLDQDMVKRGKAIYEMKCSACHKLTEQRVVGPGWLGLTKKRQPEWIMNMITNVDIMLEEDPEARKLLAECLVRMPNQNISVGDSRDILEFMRELDGEK